MRRILLALTFALFSLGLPAQQMWPTTKVHDGGPSNNRLDIVILGDGYTAGQIPLFHTHVTNFINHLLSVTPFDRYPNWINIWRVDVESQQSGADHPAPCYSNPILVNTALNSKYCTGGTQRCVTAETAISLSTAFLNVPEYDEVVVLVNDPEYGGCASTIATSTAVHSAANEVITHEMGHSVFSLADEYWSNGTTYTGGELAQVNVTNQDAASIAATQTKWHYWLGIENVNAFEGGRYFQFGIWRPRNQCKMRSLGQTFCPVCREKITETLWNKVIVPDAVTPTPPGPYGSGGAFSVTLPALGSGTLLSHWLLDGQEVSPGTTVTTGNQTTYSFVPGPFLGGGLGTSNLDLVIEDDTTYYRKSVPWEPLNTLSWIVTDAAPDYAVLNPSLVTLPSRRGELFTVTDTVTNTGTTGGPPIRVGYYLSTDTNITTSDRLVGFRTIPSLTPGASSMATTSCRIPVDGLSSLFNYHLGVIVDDENAAYEQNEADNVAEIPGLPSLDLSNTLVPDALLVPYAQPQTITFAFDAGTAHAGEDFYVFPSATPPGSGTDFGIFVGTAPFTFDTVSFMVADGTLGPPFFNGFQGQLDGAGQAAPTLFKPPLPNPGASTSLWFFGFTTATDPNDGSVSVPIMSTVPILFFF